jgi:glycosyltransferase involved in cell wall biosynthesis
MRILMTIGIFAPESGGPATYAPELASRLAEAGHEVTVLTYSTLPSYDFDSKYKFKLVRIVRGGRILNRFRFFAAAWKHVRSCDLIYTLDWFAAGLPVMMAARMRGKKYIVRVGGDYLWEQKYLESGAEPVTLADFYARGLYLRSSYTMAFRLIRPVLMHAQRVIFNSDQERELYEKYYGLLPAKTATIYNPMPHVEKAGLERGAPTDEFIYWGRLIVMKNVSSLIRAFGKARLPVGYTLTVIGDGPQQGNLERLIKELHLEEKVRMLPSMPNREALTRVKDARAFILPSWTDISPNQVCEALAIGLPALVTRENYLSFRDQLPERTDPHSVDDIAAKLEMLADDARYGQFVNSFNMVSFEHTWDDVLREHIELFDKVLKNI